MKIKFNLYNVSINGQREKVYYWRHSNYADNGIIIIMAKQYGQRLAEFIGMDGIAFDNGTDIYTDYFCKDTLYIYPHCALYNEVAAIIDRHDVKRGGA